MSITNPEDDLYFLTTSAQLSEGEAGGTDIENVDPRDLGPVTTRQGLGIAPRTIHFNAATPSIQGAATIEEAIAGAPTEELKEGTDLIDDSDVRTSFSQA